MENTSQRSTRNDISICIRYVDQSTSPNLIPVVPNSAHMKGRMSMPLCEYDTGGFYLIRTGWDDLRSTEGGRPIQFREHCLV